MDITETENNNDNVMEFDNCDKYNNVDISSETCSKHMDEKSLIVDPANIKECDFGLLINNVKRDMLQKCLSKILNFLDNAALELEFRNISKLLDEILLRIVKDVNILKNKNISCKILCKNIMQRVNMYNSGIYTLTCFYKQEAQNTLFAGLNGNSRNILVYKKIYSLSVTEKITSTHQSTPSSDSEISEDEDSYTSKPERPQPLSDHFKNHSLNLILKFVKEKSQASLVFSGLTKEKAEFVYSMFNGLISDDFNGGFAIKKIFPALWEAVKILSLKYEFSINYMDSVSDKKHLLLEKTEKDNANVLKEVLDVCEGSTPKKDRYMRKERFILKLIPQEFIIDSLKKVHQFLQDDSEASLLFHKVSEREMKFLKKVIDYSRSPNIKSLFDSESQKILDEIQIFEERKKFGIKFKHQMTKTGSREFQFIKVPNYDMPEPQSRAWYPEVETFKDLTSDESSAKRKKMDSSQKLQGLSTPYFIQQSGDTTQDRRNSSSSLLESERDSVLAQVMTRSETNLNKLKPKVATPRNTLRYKKRNNGVHGRTGQLLEALSVPVKSDKAIKMMLGMGWTGGALGSRGNGITEPIMPHLKSITGAGLGHEPKQELLKGPPSVTLKVPGHKRTPAVFRQQFLQQLLELLTSTSDTKTISFHPILKKKETAFMRRTMKAFGTRSTFRLADDVQAIVNEIAAQYRMDPELLVFACVGDDRRQIVLTKLHSAAAINKKDKSLYEISDNESFEDNIQTLLDGYRSLCHSQKIFDTTKFRVEVLMKMLKLIKNDTEHECEFKIDNDMTLKQKHIIEKSVKNINKRTVFGANAPELAVTQAIQRNTRCFDLKLDLNSTAYKVTKDYSVKESRNPSSVVAPDLPDKNCGFIKGNSNKTLDYDELYSENDYKTEDENNYNNSADNVGLTYEINGKANERQDFHKIANNINEYIDFSDDTLIEKNDKTIENTAKDGEEIVIEYDDSISEVHITQNTHKITDYNDDNMRNTEQLNHKTTQSLVNNDEVILKSTDNTNKPKDITKVSIIPEVGDANINKTGEITTVQSTTDIIIETNVTTDDQNNLTLDNAIDKMSISDNSQSDYSVIGIDDVSMSEGKLTDWDTKASDSESDSLGSKLDLSLQNTKLDAAFIELKNKHLKYKQRKTKTDTKLVSLSKPYVLAQDLRKYIQRMISFNILQSEKLPMLKCYGVYNGSLMYSCHNQKSYDWLLDMCVANKITMLVEEYDKMSFKINWFYDIDDNYVFSMLDLYNKDISTEDWSILKREVLEECVLFVVKMDKKSFKFILDSDLALYAGVDKVHFTIVWE